MQYPERSLVGDHVQQPSQAAEANPGRSFGWLDRNGSPEASPPGSPTMGRGEGYFPLMGFQASPRLPDATDPKPSLPSRPFGHAQTEDAKFLRGIGRGAHVWTTYVKETKEFDNDMVDGWNRSLDVTLVFAALFSAILTAFVNESAKLLKPDPSEQTVVVLKAILQTLQGNTTGHSLTNLSDVAEDADSQPTRNAIWVNCLWYLSLSISVAVTLAAMLAKQWCYHYLSARSGDTITQAEERQQRYNGLTKWRMQGILEQLPMMMHISLGMWSHGLVEYEETEPQFVKDALEWLIFNSQNSDSIDTAIGALAISRVKVDDDHLSDKINSHLVKHFSDCFGSSENRTKMEILRHQKALKSALDYIDWMSFFAGDDHESISKQASHFVSSLGTETVTNLGLALASLVEQKNLPSKASENVALWLSSFIRLYDEGGLYLSEDVLSIFIDGLTIAGQTVGRDQRDSDHTQDASSRARILVVPSLINILWKVSHIDESALRSSIAVNLAVFALTTKLPYPVSKDNFDSTAHYLAYEYRSSSGRNSSFGSFVVFALLGFIHPESQLGLNGQSTVTTACQIIRETNYLAKPDGAPKDIPELAEFNSFRRQLTPMLIESMLLTAPDRWESRRCLFDTAFRDRKLPDYWKGHTCQTIPAEASTSHSYTIVEDDGTRPHDSGRMAGMALALVIKNRHNVKQCFETAVRAVLLHMNRTGCGADLVTASTKWFSRTFPAVAGRKEFANEAELLQMCGYMRILTTMAVHCIEPKELATRLFDRAEARSEAHLHEDVEKKLQLVAKAAHDMNIRAFGVSSLAIWRFACPNETFSPDARRLILDDLWSLVAKHDEYKLGPEALEALLDQIALLTIVSEPAIILSNTEAQTLLQLLDQLPETEDHVRPALGVALTICGLCLDAETWDFWTLAERKKCWRKYAWPKKRKRDTPALYLLGLSRLLAHYEPLMLNPASIKTIALEIDRYMEQHADTPMKRLTLPFLDGHFDVRRHVRECVWKYLRDTESQAPFTKSMAASRDELRTAVQYDGGEGFLYEAPQPFARTKSDGGP
ncbi:hypothetical protein FRC07_011399 [Ceratobasidium sp. 392]|nr:hypothetical protein FRC07_011399 [Ceratobasidium sp. 392]